MPVLRAPFRRGPGSLYRKLKSLEFLLTRDRAAVRSFLRARFPLEFPLGERLALLRAYVRTTNDVRGYHTLSEMLTIAERILARAGPVVVECGAGKGASTAKLSLAVARAGGRLLVCDSFRGIPPNDERHERLDGRPIVFRDRAFAGTLASVRRTVERHGAIEVCAFVKGLFEESLVALRGPVDVVALDVDLLASTRTCIRWLWPRLRAGGVLFTQDGHLRAVVEMLGDPRFWHDEVGCPPPPIPGLGSRKLLEIRKSKSGTATVLRVDAPRADARDATKCGCCPRFPYGSQTKTRRGR